LKLPKNLEKGFDIYGPKPYPYQYDSIVYGLQRDNTGLLLDLGLGKTRCALDVARYRIKYNGVRRVLVVCPTSLMFNWEKEIDLFTEYPSIVLHGHKEDRLAWLNTRKNRFFIINYEYLYRLLAHLEVLRKITKYTKKYEEAEKKRNYHLYRGSLTKALKTKLDHILKQEKPKTKKQTQYHEDAVKIIKRLNFDMVICDESSRYIKNVSTDRTKAATLIADQAKYRLILTATPIENKPIDVFAQFRLLDGGKTFGDNFYKFRHYFFKNIGRGYDKWVPKPERIPVFQNRIYSTCIRFKKGEVLKDLPDQINQTIELLPSANFIKQYEELKKNILADIETEYGSRTVVKTTNILTKLLRLQQFTSGFAVGVGDEADFDSLENIKTKQTKDTPKLDALLEQVDKIVDAGESVVVWARFHKTLDMISTALTKLKIKNVVMSGHDNAKEKYKKWKGFQKSQTINVFVCQIQTGAYGVELFKHDSTTDKSQHNLIYENDWSLGVRTQMTGRTHRIGQKSTVMYTDIVMKGTIDERLLKAIADNSSIADSIVERGVKGFLDG